MNLFQLFASITLDTNDYKKGLSSARTDTQEFGKDLSSLFAIAQSEAASRIGEIAKSIGNIGLSMIKTGTQYNMTIETMTANLTTLLGSSEAAEEMIAQLTDYAAKTPFEMPGLMEAVQTMLAFGVPAESVMSDLKMMGDISLGNSEKLRGLALVFGQVSAQGKMTGQDLIQFVNAGFSPVNEMAKMTGESVADLKDKMSTGAIGIEEIRAAMEHATSQGGMFYGGMERGAETASGKISTLTDGLNILAGKIFDNVYPAFKGFIDFAIGVVDALSEHPFILKVVGAAIVAVTVVCFGLSAALQVMAASAIIGAAGMATFTGTILPIVAVIGAVIFAIVLIASTFEDAGEASQTSANAISDSSAQIQNDLSGIGDSAGKADAQVRSSSGGIVEAFQSMVSNAKSALQALPMTIGTIALNAGQNFANNLKANHPVIYSVAEGIGRMVINGTSAIPSSLNKIASSAMTLFISNISNARNSALNNANALRQVIVNGINSLPALLGNLSSSAMTLFISNISNARSPVMNAAAGIGQTVLNGVNNLPTQLGNIGSSAINLMVAQINSGRNSANNAAGNILTAIKNGLNNLDNTLSRISSSAVSSFVSEIQNAKNSAQNASNAIASAVLSGMNSQTSSITSKARQIANDIVSNFNGVVSNARSSGSAIVNGVAGGISSAANAVLQTINNIINSIKSTLNSFTSTARSAGNDIGKGISDGVKNGMDSGSLPTWIKNLVDDAVKAAKRAAGVNSPSWIFAEIGSYCIEGLKLGMESQYGNTIKSFSNFADNLSGTEIGFNTVPTSGAFATASGVGGGVTVVQNIYAAKQSPAELAAATEAYFQRARWM